MIHRSAFAALAACALLLAACGKSEERTPPPPGTAGRAIGGVLLPEADLQDALASWDRWTAGTQPSEPDHNTLAMRVREALLAERVLLSLPNQSITQSVAEVEAAVLELRSAAQGDPALATRLGPLATEPDRLRQAVQDTLRVRDILRDRVPGVRPATAQDIADYYGEHAEDFIRKARARIFHILVAVPPTATNEEVAAARQRAESARARIVAGEPFDTVAREMSDDKATAGRGGDLGSVSLGALVPEFEQAALNSSKGTLSPVFASRFGWHVLVVAEIEQVVVVSVDQAREEIAQLLDTRQAHDRLVRQRAQFANDHQFEFFPPVIGGPSR
jgi:hypothetical protein